MTSPSWPDLEPFVLDARCVQVLQTPFSAFHLTHPMSPWGQIASRELTKQWTFPCAQGPTQWPLPESLKPPMSRKSERLSNYACEQSLSAPDQGQGERSRRSLTRCSESRIHHRLWQEQGKERTRTSHEIMYYEGTKRCR